MLKRLIEVALPLKEVSEQSAREKSIRHGHISTLHIWWARRPLAACRAVVFASLIPDPDDPECPESFRTLVRELLGRSEFKPKNGDGSPTEDTPRNRCLEFIKQLVRWENSNVPEYVEPARKLIAAAHYVLSERRKDEGGRMNPKPPTYEELSSFILHPSSFPKVLDPFAGGGAIPLEALRLGCEAHAIDLNPVAHLIELCTLVYPQKYGQPDSRPVPEYIKRLNAHNRGRKKRNGQPDLFNQGSEDILSGDEEIIPDVEITEVEYHQNPLAADVKYWGHWVLERARKALDPFYQNGTGQKPLAYIWARTVQSPDPSIRAEVPLVSSLWLSKKTKAAVALRMTPDLDAGCCHFHVVHDKEIDFDPDRGTIRRGQLQCPFSGVVMKGEDLRRASKTGRMRQQMIAVVEASPTGRGKCFRPVTGNDINTYNEAENASTDLALSIPHEPITEDRPSPNSRGLSAVSRYGIDEFGKLFNPRQALALCHFASAIKDMTATMRHYHDDHYAIAVSDLLACSFSRLVDQSSTLVRWLPQLQAVASTFGRQALAMTWDYVEAVPISAGGGGFASGIEWVYRVVVEQAKSCERPAGCTRGTATALPAKDMSFNGVITDPPYYDAVPYSDLSDFFYVWLKRALSPSHNDLFLTPLTPKAQELIAYYGSGKRKVNKLPEWYEANAEAAFKEMRRVLCSDGIAVVMFAHKTTAAWETTISGLLRAGLLVTSSWPIHTERAGRLLAIGTASLASSVSLVCRKRHAKAGAGLWDDVRQQLQSVARERLDFFWSQGIRGADFFISAIGPALSVFGQYEKVTMLSGEEVTVGQFLDEVRSLVTGYALTKILKTTHTGSIDPESRFYVVWKWSYGDAKVPADESFKLSQALGLDSSSLWDKTGVLEKAGENVLAAPIAKRMKLKNLGEPSTTGAPASLIDVLHRMCAFREKGDTQGMAQFLARSGHANNHSLWLIAQAVSEILPDGDKEKQLMQGLLNQKDGLIEATRQGELF